MHKLEQLYNNASKRLNQDIDIIIQAFINYYGINNSEYITNRLKNSRIIWFDDKSVRSDNIYNQIISSIPKEELDIILKQRNELAFIQSTYIMELDILVLPLSYDLTQIIHELNHKIGSHTISNNPLLQINGISYYVEKDKIVTYDNELNEIINQKITIEIIKILREMGLNIDISPSWQELLFPLINYFYDNFKNSIKDVIITGNLLKFKESLGEEYYEEFSQKILLSFYKYKKNLGIKEIISFPKEKINSINELVENMKIHNETLSSNTRKSGVR